MAQTLFGSATPANTDQNNGPPGITTATRIRAAVAGTCRVRYRFPDTPLSGAAQWLAVMYDYATDSPGAGLGSGVFLSQTAGTWNLADATFHVEAGDEFVVEVWNADGRYVNTLDFFLLDVVSGDLTGPAEEDPARYNGRFDVGGSIAFPESGFRANGYFVDVEFTPDTPDPGQVTLTPATGTFTPVAGAPTPGVVTVTLTPATGTFSAVAGTPSPAAGARSFTTAAPRTGWRARDTRTSWDTADTDTAWATGPIRPRR